MANHGYMPRNGVGNIQDFIDGTAAVFGMGKSYTNCDLASYPDSTQPPTFRRS